EWLFEGDVTLPGPCTDWTFYHSENARNNAITTVQLSGLDLFDYCVINNTINVCNNSPVFSNKPVTFPCMGQNFFFNHGAYDAEGDSLSFDLITPRTGPLASDTIS